MSKNILVRDLSEDQQQKLEALRDSFGEKTTSKTILYMIDKFGDLMEETRRLRVENHNVRERSSSLERFLETIKAEVKSFSEEEEDDYENWD